MDYKKLVLHLVIFCIFFVSVMSMVTAEVAGLGTGGAQTSFAAFLNGPSSTFLSDFLSEPVIINNLDPTITSISPTSARINDAPFSFTVNGSNFVDGYKIVIGNNGYGGSTLYNSPNQLELNVLDPSTLTLGQHDVFVRPPASAQAGDSNTVVFTIYNPIPNPTSIAPASAPSGSPDLNITVTGTNFVNGAGGSLVRINGYNLVTEYVSPTQVRATILAQYMTTPGTLNITVHNASVPFEPDTIPAVPFTVTPAVPNVMQPLP